MTKNQWHDVKDLPPKDTYVNVLVQLNSGGQLREYYALEKSYWTSTMMYPVYWDIQNNGIVVAWSLIVELPDWAKNKLLTTKAIGVY